MSTTTHLGITLVEPSQAQKEVTVNQALTRIDAVLNTGAISQTTNTPPGSPADGDLYIVGSSPTGDWAGQAGKLAYFDQLWRFITPREGMALWVADEDKLYIHNGSGWVEFTPGGSATGGGNKFRNATFDIWQRGPSVAVAAGSPAYTADGWIAGYTGAGGTVMQQPGKSLSLYSLRATGAMSVTGILIKQRMESYLCAVGGQQVTVQAQIYNNTGGAITPTLTVKHAGAADDWSSPVTDVNAVNLQNCADSQWTQVAYTFTAHANSGNGLEIIFDFGNNFGAGTKYVQIAEADIRVTPEASTGLNNSPPAPEMRHMQTELAFCQRYLPAFLSSSTTYGFAGLGVASNATIVKLPVKFPVTARTVISGVQLSSGSHFSLTDGANIVNTTAVSLAASALATGRDLAVLDMTTAGGLVQFRPYYARMTNASGYLLFTGAEL